MVGKNMTAFMLGFFGMGQGRLVDNVLRPLQKSGQKTGRFLLFVR